MGKRRSRNYWVDTEMEAVGTSLAFIKKNLYRFVFSLRFAASCLHMNELSIAGTKTNLLMKTKILPFVFLFSFSASAQDSSFQLKDCKYRTPGFKTLTLGLNMSGTTSSSKSSSQNEDVSTNFNLVPTHFAFTKIISTETRLHQSTFTLLPRVNVSKTKENNEERKFNQFQASFQWERSDRLYKSSLHFIEFGNLFDASVINQNLKQTQADYKSTSLQLQNTLSIGFGRGRIERVQDAQMALFILNDLKAQGLLHGEVTAAEVNFFAQLITEINNKRVFDFRRRRVYELTRLDSFLQSSGLVQKTDVRHFTTVNDNWASAINPYRQSGTAWFIRVKPGFDYSHSSVNEKFPAGSSSKRNVNGLSFSLTPEVGIEKYIPTSLRWQQNMGVTLAYNISKHNRTFENTSLLNTTMYEWEVNSWRTRFTGFYGVGLFPNNRTRVGLDLLTNFYYGVTHLNSFKERRWTLSPELNLHANYFIGYRTYLNATAYFLYHYSRYEPINNKNRNLNATINLGFSHILF